MRYALILFAALLLGTTGDGCSTVPDSETIQNQAQERANLQAVQAVGFPNIVNHFEKRQLKTIYELRDQEIATYAYTQAFDGHYIFLCNSIGYGIPYATEYTNPQQPAYSGSNGGITTIAQADPNGLYSPSNAAGTWVLCGKKGDIHPVYVEPNVIVSPFKLN